MISPVGLHKRMNLVNNKNERATVGGFIIPLTILLNGIARGL
jgi:hypothetical protein